VTVLVLVDAGNGALAVTVPWFCGLTMSWLVWLSIVA
jgi:hypothetical protein